jgi:subtilisin family serine protease
VKRAGTLVAAAAALVAPAHAGAARFAVGVDPAAPTQHVAKSLQAFGDVSRDLTSLHVLVVEGSTMRGVRRIHGVRWAEWLGARNRRVAFTPNDTLVSRQWYLATDRAFDFWPDVPPSLTSVKVAVVDSGIDATHPDLAGRIADTRSFVPGSVVDTTGHGTFVAGEIAASINNAQGIAGIAFPAQLLVAKVVRNDESISLEAEAKAIRWAVDSGARVINLSLGGLRDPRDPSNDAYSPLEAAAVDYAAAKGVVVVAAVGNSDDAPVVPWPFASYPAALPHVVGVSSLTQAGDVSSFSQRDVIFNDIAAPGEDILSTLPRALTRDRPTCVEQGYSICGPPEYRHAEGTSFATPQVTAAAALLLAQHPTLTANQVTTLLERAAVDLNASTGCSDCTPFRDSLSGWGKLDIAGALTLASGTLPPPDRYETNDDVSARAARLSGARGQRNATIDYWDDQTDVYPVDLTARRRFSASVAGPAGTSFRLRLWSPRTRTVYGASSRKLEVVHSTRTGAKTGLTYVVPAARGGRYYLQVTIQRAGAGAYTLRWTRR